LFDMPHPLLIGVCLLAGDWPQFRGPNSDGRAVDSKTPLEWSDTKNVKWKAPIPGLGWSSPALVSGRIFLTTAVPSGDGLSLRALALDARTGGVLWDREVRAVAKAPSIHAKNSHASPTPVVRGDAVFVHFGALGMARLNVADGAVRWFCDELQYPPLHGSGGSPVWHDGKLAVVCDGSVDPFVAAVDAEAGKVVWKTPRAITGRQNHSFVTPLVWEVAGKPQVFAPGPDHFAAYDLANGRELWRIRAPGWSVVPQPTVGHGLVIYNRDYDHPELIAARMDGRGDVTDSHVVWRIKKAAPSTPTPLLVDDDLYFVSDKGIASCVDAKTGDRHWMERLPGNYSASPVFVNGRVLFLNETGLASWVRLGRKFSILGKCEVPGRTFATPAFDSDAMYLRTDRQLYKIAE
jgi:outer membrane protein assembly factor BamB